MDMYPSSALRDLQNKYAIDRKSAEAITHFIYDYSTHPKNYEKRALIGLNDKGLDQNVSMRIIQGHRDKVDRFHQKMKAINFGTIPFAVPMTQTGGPPAMVAKRVT